MTGLRATICSTDLVAFQQLESDAHLIESRGGTGRRSLKSVLSESVELLGMSATTYGHGEDVRRTTLLELTAASIWTNEPFYRASS